MDIFKLAAVAVMAALWAATLRGRTPELALVLVLAAGAALLGEAGRAMASARGVADALGQTAGLSAQVWAPVWKTVGIALVSRLSAAVCRDAGEGALGAFLETAGTALALGATLPLLELVLEVLGGLLCRVWRWGRGCCWRRGRPPTS